MTAFQDIYAICNSGTGRQKYDTLPSGPRMIDVEPVGLCNMRCVMCPTGLGALGRRGGFMTGETHRAILKKTEEFGSAIRYIGWGEPLMHPRIADFVCVADDRLTHINTNGSKLTQWLADDLVDAGLSSIKFSFQGVDRETYKTMRRSDFFEGVIRAIEAMHMARGMSVLPVISASTTTTSETPEMIEAFRERVEPFVDSLSIGYTIFDFIDMAAVSVKDRRALEEAAALAKVDKRHPDPCPEVYDKLTVHWDGSVRVCCNDFSGITCLGNINENSMEEIWRHPQIEAYRVRLAGKDYNAPLCKDCFDYMSCTEGTNVVSPALVG